MSTALRLSDPVLVKLTAARQALAQAKTIQAAKRIADLAAAAKVYARQQQLGQEAIDFAHAVRVEALRRLGELLKPAPKRAGGRGAKGGGRNRGSKKELQFNAPPTLADVGLTKKQSHVAQKLAELPKDQFEAVRAGSASVTQAIRGTSRTSVHFSSETPEHYTPAAILEAVRTVFGDIPDLDPCSNDRQAPNVRARAYYTAVDDGLTQPWFGKVFLNPPYGREIGDWITKLRDEWRRTNVEAAIALLPARTDTEWFDALTMEADDLVLCFLRGRLTFVGNTDPAPFPSMVAYIGRRHDLFADVFLELGSLWQRPPRGYFVSHE